MPNQITGSGGSAPPNPNNFQAPATAQGPLNPSKLTRVTDPALQAQLDAAAQGLKPVTDPVVLKQLEALPNEQAQPSGYVDQMKQGVSDAVAGVGKTLDVNSAPGGTVNAVGKALEKYGASWAPKDFVPADLIDAKGFHVGNIGKYLARGAPATGATVGAGALAAFLAPELGAGATLTGAATLGAGAGTQFAMNAGNEEQEAANNAAGKPNAEITAAAKARGLATAGVESALTALPVTRYLPGVGKLANTGAAGAVRALKKLGVTAVDQGAASAGANTAEQVGQTIGTPGGVSVDPNQVANSAAGGALTGAIFGAPKATRETLDAAKYRGITPDLQQAATQVANRVVQNADGQNLQGSLLRSGSAQRAGEAAVHRTGFDIRNELNTAISDLRSRVTLPVDADNVLRSAVNGQQPTEGGYAALQDAVAGDPQGANVLNLVRQSHAFDVLNDSGHHVGDKFTGGVGGFFRHILTGENVAKSAMVGLGAAALEEGAGHLIAYSPQALAMAAGGAVAARLLDSVTGAQTPAGRFVRNFADDSTAIRAPISQAMIDRVSRPGPTGPKIPLAPEPWGPPQPASQAELLTPAQKQQMVLQAMPVLRTLARMNKPAPATPEINPLALPKNITGPAATLMRGATLAQRLRENQQPVAEAPAAIDPLALPPNITGPAKSIARGTVLARKLKDTQAAQAAPASAVPNSVSKAGDGTVTSGSGNLKRPLAPYASLPVAEAAKRILNDRITAGVPIADPATYLAKIHGVLKTLREKVQEVQEAAPIIPAADVARFEGVKSQKAATQYRDILKAEFPQAADVLDRVFSNHAIATQWNARQ